MNLMARPCEFTLPAAVLHGTSTSLRLAQQEEAIEGDDADHDYLYARVLDTFLRENVRSCVSRASLVSTADLPKGMSLPDGPAQWLFIRQFASGDQTHKTASNSILAAPPDASRLWIPVQSCHFMQRWQLARDQNQRPQALIWCNAAGCRVLTQLDDVIDAFAQGLTAEAAHGYADFVLECQAALAQRKLCMQQQQQFFAQTAKQATAPDSSIGRDSSNDSDSSSAAIPWWRSLLHYERLAAWQDHPFYPSARAKLGFGAADLMAYAPEFAPEFELNWLAVHQDLWHGQGPINDLSDPSTLPGWPGMEQVGLPAALAHSHHLLPVHPFMWQQLPALLAQTQVNGQSLQTQLVLAPLRALRVTPSLSVRSLMLCQAPEWHVKLPLPIRTLGQRNIRTIGPDTLPDGALVQHLLAAILAREASLGRRILLTNEDVGAHVAGLNFLGMIVRRYPQAQLADSTVVPVAGLCAPTAGGVPVLAELITQFYEGDEAAFWQEYLSLTLDFHLTLWLRYGVALESNQQNSMLVLSRQSGVARLRLLFKDNDAARINPHRLQQQNLALGQQAGRLRDQRMLVPDELALAQMFTTITLQLNIAAVFENLHWPSQACGQWRYALLRELLAHSLQRLQAAGVDVQPARQYLQQAEHQYLKYLLVAATLVDKQTSGAQDVNKFYGLTAPNFLREP